MPEELRRTHESMSSMDHGSCQENQGRNPDRLSLDACLELLSSRQRRIILKFFLESDPDHASFDDIVSQIVDDEARLSGERPGHDAIAATLFHVHLPKFADADILDYDTRHQEIRYQGDPRLEELYSKIQELQ